MVPENIWTNRIKEAWEELTKSYKDDKNRKKNLELTIKWFVSCTSNDEWNRTKKHNESRKHYIYITQPAKSRNNRLAMKKGWDRGMKAAANTYYSTISDDKTLFKDTKFFYNCHWSDGVEIMFDGCDSKDEIKKKLRELREKKNPFNDKKKNDIGRKRPYSLYEKITTTEDPKKYLRYLRTIMNEDQRKQFEQYVKEKWNLSV